MKKFLSMALSLAMALSLFTFAAPSAGAESIARVFTDKKDIKYNEAIDVISTIELMDGYSDGSFRPTGGLTRGAATKIICNMLLGPSAANSLPANASTQFSDVASGSTFAAYIAWCVSHNIVSGYADGTFKPADPLSGYAFLKMLLGALGYDQVAEGYQGDAWRVNVATQAIKSELLNDYDGDFNGVAALNREEAALFAFNTLQADMVEYTSSNTVTVNGATVTIGNNSAKVKTWGTSSTSSGNINDETDGSLVGGNIVQFAEENFNKLKKIDNDDALGRPSTKWEWKSDEIGDYPDKPVKTYWEDKEADDIYKDLGMSTTADTANTRGQNELHFFVNGVEQTVAFALSRSNSNKIGENYTDKITNRAGTVLYDYADVFGDGTRIEVFRDDDNNVTICAAGVYGGEVTSVKAATSDRDRYVVVTPARARHGVKTANPFPVKSNGDAATLEFETPDFKEDDIVGYTYSAAEDEIQELFLLESVEGTLNRYTTDKSVQISSSRGNTTYKYAKMLSLEGDIPVPQNVSVNIEENLSTGDDYVVYLDTQGYALWIEDVEGTVDGYALLEAAEFAGDSTANLLREDRAKLLFTDGTERTVYVDTWPKYGNATKPDAEWDKSTDIAASGHVLPIMVKYEVKSNGDYKLSTVANDERIDGVTVSVTSRTLTGLRNNNNVTVAADSKTIFVVDVDSGSGTDYRYYTGIRNVPNVSGSAVGYAYYKDNTAKVVFITNGITSTSSKDVVFIAANSASGVIRDGDNRYRVFNAVERGEITEIMVSVGLTGQTLNGATNGTDNSANPRKNIGGRTFSLFAAPAGASQADDPSLSVIVNNTTSNTDDLITNAYYASDSIGVYRARGLRAASSGEIRVGTFDRAANPSTFVTAEDVRDVTELLANNVRAYSINDDGDITEVDVYSLVRDDDDWVFYTMDDGEITNIFVIEDEYDSGDEAPAPTPTPTPSYSNTVTPLTNATAMNALAIAPAANATATVDNSANTVTYTVAAAVFGENGTDRVPFALSDRNYWLGLNPETNAVSVYAAADAVNAVQNLELTVQSEQAQETGSGAELTYTVTFQLAAAANQ